MGQTNISGKPGLIYTPTARYVKDGNLNVGINVYPGDFGFQTVEKNPGRVIYFNLTILPRFDINVNLLQLFSTAANPVKLGLGDRQLDFRYLILKEKKYQPSLAIILSNPTSVSPTLLTHALVATKNFGLSHNMNLEASIGYGSKYHMYRKGSTLENYGLFENLVIEKKSLYSRHKHYLEGPFAGLSLQYKKKAGLMLEYDSKNINAGLYAILWKRWTLQVAVMNGQQITAGTSFNFDLLKLPKRISKSNE